MQSHCFAGETEICVPEPALHLVPVVSLARLHFLLGSSAADSQVIAAASQGRDGEEMKVLSTQ